MRTYLKNLQFNRDESIYLTATICNAFVFLGTLLIALVQSLYPSDHKPATLLTHLGATSVAFIIAAGIANKFRFRGSTPLGLNTLMTTLTIGVIILARNNAIQQALSLTLYILAVTAITVLISTMIEVMLKRTNRVRSFAHDLGTFDDKPKHTTTNKETHKKGAETIEETPTTDT